MSEFSYIKLNHYMLTRPKLAKTIVFLCKGITNIFYVMYPLFLLAGFYRFRLYMLKFALVPLVSLIIVSVIRAKLNLPRPYEQFNITPLYDKKTKGKSFPSRHTFSVFIITFTLYFFVSPLIFSILLLLSILLAILRVLLGVHLVRDVLTGFLFAIISALIGYVII